MSHDSEVGDDEIEAGINRIKDLSNQDVVIFKVAANLAEERRNKVEEAAREYNVTAEELLKNDKWMQEIEEEMQERVDELEELMEDYNGADPIIEIQKHGKICITRNGEVDLFPGMQEDNIKHNIIPSQSIEAKETKALSSAKSSSLGKG